MSAPNSMGLQRMGVAKVLSMTSGRPFLWATAAKRRMSSTLRAGFARLSA